MSVTRIPTPVAVTTRPAAQLTDQNEQKVAEADVRTLLQLMLNELKTANVHNQDITGIEVNANELNEH